jgi:hypothetical protein
MICPHCYAINPDGYRMCVSCHRDMREPVKLDECKDFFEMLKKVAKESK